MCRFACLMLLPYIAILAPDPLRLSFGFWNNKGKTLVHLDYRWTIDRLLAGIRRTPPPTRDGHVFFQTHKSNVWVSLSGRLLTRPPSLATADR